MSYIPLDTQRDIATLVEDGTKKLEEILINPVRYRSELFTAVKLSHSDEVIGRYVHYDSRRDPVRLPTETSRSYIDSTSQIEIDVKVSKAGQRFRIEGTINDKFLCQSFCVIAFLKTIPAKTPKILQSQNIPTQTPSLFEFRERLISMQLQLEEIRANQNILLERFFRQDTSNVAVQNQTHILPEDMSMVYPPYQHYYPRQDCPSSHGN